MFDYEHMTAEQLRRPIEPFIPEVGMRVRVHVSPECEHVYELGVTSDGYGQLRATTKHRLELENGLIGVVTSAPPGTMLRAEYQGDGHNVCVRFIGRVLPLPGEEGSIMLGTGIEAMLFAAFELEPVDSPSGMVVARGKYER